MNRLLSAFAIALALGIVVISSVGHSFAQRSDGSASFGHNGYGPGEYDRLTNGSPASTPGHN